MYLWEYEVAQDIADFMRRLYSQQLTTASGGNISVRYGEKIFMTPGGSDKGKMESSEIGCLSLSGEILTPGFKPTCESEMHLALYRCRKDVNAVVHAHPVTASAFSASNCEISSRLLAESNAILKKIGRVPYFHFGTPELAAAAAEIAVQNDVFLLNNHGAIALGTTLLEAFDRLEVLENAAKLTLICEYQLKSPVYLP